MATKTDYQVASLAAGFTIGFGFLTVWEAINQTAKNKNPLRSSYIYMIWGEILANLVIGIIGWLFLDGTLGAKVPVLFFILFLWVWEVQLLMQIIINRIALIAEHRSTVTKLKWGTAVLITAVNVAVFAIWIPAHLDPPTSHVFVQINKYWDRISKVIILIVDAWLNWYFLRTVNVRLVQQHGLIKYKPLVGFNAKLMVVSIAMDVMLIGLMSFPNAVVYIQFHPVAYMVKLNIEMSMASLVVRLARGRTENDGVDSSSDPRSHGRSGLRDPDDFNPNGYRMKGIGLSNKVGHKSVSLEKHFDREGTDLHSQLHGTNGIHRRTDVEVLVEEMDSNTSGDVTLKGGEASSRSSKSIKEGREDGDEIPLTPHSVRPQQTSTVL